MNEDRLVGIRKETRYQLVGGPGTQIGAALEFCSIMATRMGQKPDSVPGEVELQQEEQKTYNSAMKVLRKLWESEAAPVQQVVVSHDYERTGEGDYDLIAQAIEYASLSNIASNGRNGFFSAEAFAKHLAVLVGSGAELSSDYTKALLDDRWDVAPVDGSIGLYANIRRTGG